MPVIAESQPHGDGSDGAPLDAVAQRHPARSAGRAGPSALTILLCCLPAILVGLLIRAWLLHTSLSTLNSDEGITGLQGLEVLSGRFRLVVAGNDYGSTTESYLVAPLLTFLSGPAPLRLMAVVLSLVAAYALYLLALPFYGRVVAATVALIGWTTSGAVALLWLRAYMGYPTGFIALVAALALACQAMRTRNRLAWIALAAGFATGFAIWSHPVFGAVAMLALLAPCGYRWRELTRWWLPLAAGGVLGMSPWLIYLAGHGKPQPALATVNSVWSERVQNFVAELLPRAFGLRAPDGAWISPSWLAIGAAAVLILGCFVGWVVLLAKTGRAALPIVIAGVLAFPVLGCFNQLAFVADARYALPFLPQLLIGLAAWSLLLPSRARHSPWLLVTLPTIWALALSVPVIHQQAGWGIEDPERDAYAVLGELQDRQIHYLAGDYWGAYLVDYLADGSLVARPNQSIRLVEEAQQVDAADPAAVAYVYPTGMEPSLAMPRERYQRIELGTFELYVPVPVPPSG